MVDYLENEMALICKRKIALPTLQRIMHVDDKYCSRHVELKNGSGCIKVKDLLHYFH